MIRPAKLTDLPRLCELAVMMHDESPFPLPPIDADKLIVALMKATVVVWEQNEKVGGFIALQEGTFWYSQERFIADLLFFVQPEFRKSTAGRDLIRAAQTYAKIKELPLFMAPVNGVDVDRKDALYKRLGMRKLGGTYSYGLG
jgi:GNAT superfamily N-acetyltransferase